MSAIAKLVLITGASHLDSLGYATARQLALHHGFSVILGSRSPPSAMENAVKQLESEGAKYGVYALQIDVGSDASIKNAVKEVEDKFGRLDVLINNAGVGLPENRSEMKKVYPTETLRCLDTTRLDWQETFEVNVFGLSQTINAFAPLLARSPSPRIVNVTSTMGSLAMMSGLPMALLMAYSASKSATNMLTVQYSKELPSLNSTFKINAGCPGYLKTSFNNYHGTRSVDEGAGVIVHLATIPDDGPNGGAFSDYAPNSDKIGNFTQFPW